MTIIEKRFDVILTVSAVRTQFLNLRLTVPTNILIGILKEKYLVI